MCGAKAGPKMSAPSAAAGATGASGATSAGRGAYADDKLRAAARHRTKELREARRREASTKEDDDLTNPGHDHEDSNPIHDLDDTFDDDDDDGSTDRCSDDNEDDLFTFGASGSAAAAAAAATTRNNPEASPPPAANTSDLIASSLASDNQVLADAAKFLMRVTRMTSPPLPTPPPRSPTNSPSPSPATSEDEEGSHQGSHQSESSSVLGAAKALTGIMGGSARKPSPVPTLPPMTTTLLPTKPSPPPQTTALTPAAAAAARKRSPPPPQTIARKPSPPLSPMQEDEELPPPLRKVRRQEGAAPGPTAGRRPLQRLRQDTVQQAEPQKRPSLFSRGAPRGTVPGAAAAGGRSLKRQPWSSVPLSLEAERAMEDLQVDWMDWVAPFTTAGTVSRKRARAAAGAETGKEGGEDAKPAAAKEKESPPKKKRARSMSVADLGWMRTTAFCDRNKHSIILPSTPPQQLLNAILACRGYPHRTRPALPTARSRCAVSKPSPLRAASHGPAVLRAVDSSDASALASLLHSGLHPNASDPSGNDTVLSRVCRSADLTLFWLVTEGYGVDSFVSDARGRTPLHHLCSGQGHGNNDDKDPPLVFFTLLHMILERDWRALRVADVDGKTPLDLAGKGSWPAFNRFLQSNVDHYWPRRNGRGVTSWAEIEKEERAFEALVGTMSAPTPDPENGLPVEVARGVAAGVVAPDDVVRLRRELEKGKLSATAEEEKASGASPARGSVSLPRTAQQQQNIIAGRSA